MELREYELDKPFTLISLLGPYSVVTWKPCRAEQYETWVERHGRLLGTSVHPSRARARIHHRQTVKRIQEAHSDRNRALVRWLRQGIGLGFLRPSFHLLSLSKDVQNLWRRIGQEFLFGDTDEDGLLAIQVDSSGQLGAQSQEAGD